MTGAPETFDEVLAPLLGQAYALALTMLNDRGSAEDAVQDSAVKAWRNLPRLRDRSALQPWFLSIVANQSRTARRNRWWSVLKFADLAARRSNHDVGAEDRVDLDRALDRLGPEDRSALLLHFYMDMTFEQVAAVLRISMPAARSRIYRSLAKLRADPAIQGELTNG